MRTQISFSYYNFSPFLLHHIVHCILQGSILPCCACPVCVSTPGNGLLTPVLQVYIVEQQNRNRHKHTQSLYFFRDESALHSQLAAGALCLLDSSGPHCRHARLPAPLTYSLASFASSFIQGVQIATDKIKNDHESQCFLAFSPLPHSLPSLSLSVSRFLSALINKPHSCANGLWVLQHPANFLYASMPVRDIDNGQA